MVGARIEDAMIARIAKITDRSKNALAPSVSQVVIRGLEMALAELEKKAPR